MDDAVEPDDRNSAPCAGIRVLDMTSVMSGPLCSQILADLGADVIKVESVGSDVVRFVEPLNNDIGALFEQLNRGKRSLLVDVKKPEDQELLQRLAKTVDVFVENSKPGAMDRLGLGYDRLKTLNKRLIYVSINGFGDAGPFSGRPAYDTVIQGLVGFMPTQGGERGALAFRNPVADKATGLWAANATVAALFHRDRTDGLGQKVVVNMTAAYAAFILSDQLRNDTFETAELPQVTPSLEFYRALRTLDGEVIGLIVQHSQFKRFCRALGKEDLLSDPRFSNSVDINNNIDILYEHVASVVERMTTDEFVSIMDANDVPFGRVNSVKDFIESKEAEHAGVFSSFVDPEYGAIRHINYPAKFERSRTVRARRSPRLGEHNEEIAAEAAEAGDEGG